MSTVGRWMSWAKADFSEYDAACWFETCNHTRASGEAHQFGIFSADGRYVGGCGLNQFNRINKFCNLGYWVRESRQREGAAVAASIALRNLAFTSLDQMRVEIIVAEGNTASYNAALKAGASLECLAQNRLQLHGRSVAAHVFSFAKTTGA
jgi:RimJ/RimL family protein N-acetyltransferase